MIVKYYRGTRDRIAEDIFSTVEASENFFLSQRPCCPHRTVLVTCCFVGGSDSLILFYHAIVFGGKEEGNYT